MRQDVPAWVLKVNGRAAAFVPELSAAELENADLGRAEKADARGRRAFHAYAMGDVKGNPPICPSRDSEGTMGSVLAWDARFTISARPAPQALGT